MTYYCVLAMLPTGAECIINTTSFTRAAEALLPGTVYGTGWSEQQSLSAAQQRAANLAEAVERHPLPIDGQRRYEQRHEAIWKLPPE